MNPNFSFNTRFSSHRAHLQWQPATSNLCLGDFCCQIKAAAKYQNTLRNQEVNWKEDVTENILSIKYLPSVSKLLQQLLLSLDSQQSQWIQMATVSHSIEKTVKEHQNIHRNFLHHSCSIFFLSVVDCYVQYVVNKPCFANKSRKMLPPVKLLS